MKKNRFNPQKIRDFLEREDRNQAWLAKKCGITQANICMILNNKREPSFETVAKIVEFTGIDFLELITKEGLK